MSARPRARARPRHWFSAPGEPLPMRTARRTTVAPPVPLPVPEKISGVSMPSTPGGSGSRIGRIGPGFCVRLNSRRKERRGEEEFAWRPEGSMRCGSWRFRCLMMEVLKWNRSKGAYVCGSLVFQEFRPSLSQGDNKHKPSECTRCISTQKCETSIKRVC